MSSASEHSGRSAAVTGAGGGLGRDIALGLAAKGYVVFGTAVSPAEVQDVAMTTAASLPFGSAENHASQQSLRGLDWLNFFLPEY
jgi:NAD(P)-dependent dehydrogenase (short-subunit alcohol dehydrogenase family)